MPSKPHNDRPDRASGHDRQRDETPLAFDLLAHVCPVQWDNATLYGAYNIRRELVAVRP